MRLRFQYGVAIAAFCLGASNVAMAEVVATSSISTAASGIEYEISPVSDGAIFAVSAGFAILSEMIVRTGELRPQNPVDPSNLLGIDRGIATADEVETSGFTISDITLAAVAGYALFDAGRRVLGSSNEWWGAYAVLYAETTFLNLALTNLAKIAFRRPRPIAYFELRETGMVSDDTNVALSFYSGHTATTAGLAATATYFAFARQENGWEGWVTLAVGMAATAYVAVQRVRARAHFPTDVIAGALVGAGVGVLVPHLHRTQGDQPTVRLGASVSGQSQGLSLYGSF